MITHSVFRSGMMGNLSLAMKYNIQGTGAILYLSLSLSLSVPLLNMGEGKYISLSH